MLLMGGGRYVTLLPYYLTTTTTTTTPTTGTWARRASSSTLLPYYLTTSLLYYYHYRHLGEARKLINVLREVYHVGVVRTAREAVPLPLPLPLTRCARHDKCVRYGFAPPPKDSELPGRRA